MATDSKNGGVGGLRGMGPTATFVVGMVREFGFSTVVLAVILYMVCVDWGPKVVANHIELLQATTKATAQFADAQEQNSATLAQMADTQKKLTEAVESLNNGVSQLITGDVETKEFMRTVSQQHQEQTAKLERNGETITKVYDEVKKD